MQILTTGYRQKIIFLLLLAAASTTLAHAAIRANAGPTLVIVQEIRVGTSDSTDLGGNLANFLAQELDNQGRVTPVVWSLSDPTFRAAAMAGKIGATDKPKLSDALQGASQLGSSYVIWYRIALEKGKWNGIAELFRGGSKIWHDTSTLTISKSGTSDDDATWESMARTWAEKLQAGPLQKFPSQPSISPLPTPRGQAARAPIKEDVVLGVKGNAQISGVAPGSPPLKRVADGPDSLPADVDSLIKAGRTSTALLRARDGVDAQPLSVGRRALLIRVLRENGQDQAAAEETRRLADLQPDNYALRLNAAQSWIDLGLYQDAQNAINESLARDPNRIETRILQSELALKMLQPEIAVISLEEVIKKSPTAQAYGLRAVARALLGGEDGVSLDLSHGDKLKEGQSPSQEVTQYRFQMSVIDTALATQSTELRSVFQIVTVKPKDISSQEEVSKYLRIFLAVGRLLSEVTVPPSHTASHSQRQLAQKLLVQSLMDLRSFTQSGSEDALTDARINLGEAIKKGAVAKSSFGKEQGLKDDGISAIGG